MFLFILYAPLGIRSSLHWSCLSTNSQAITSARTHTRKNTNTQINSVISHCVITCEWLKSSARFVLHAAHIASARCILFVHRIRTSCRVCIQFNMCSSLSNRHSITFVVVPPPLHILSICIANAWPAHSTFWVSFFS